MSAALSRRERWAMPEFCAPLPLAMVALLAWNDLVLKPYAPGFLTGKLSDVAICFFLPLFVSAMLGLCAPWSPRARVRVGAAITAVLFTALEVIPAAADLFCTAIPAAARLVGIRLHYRLWSDPSDLLCLAFTWLAVLWGDRRLQALNVASKESS